MTYSKGQLGHRNSLANYFEHLVLTASAKAAEENETLSILTQYGSIAATSGRMPLSAVPTEPKYLNSSAF